jgi:nitrogen regulatory protein PII
MNCTHEVIFCIVNAGFSDAVMDAAKEFGARGGTVIRARGTANAEAEKLFHIAVQPEKEIVMILVDSKIKNDILHALYRAVGLKTPGQGIAFSMPVDEVVGLSGGANTEPAPEAK